MSQPPLQTKIKLNLKRRADDFEGGIDGNSGQAGTEPHSGASTPPEGTMTSSSSMVSLGPDGMPKVKKIKISLGGKPLAGAGASGEQSSWSGLDKEAISEHCQKLAKNLREFKQGGQYLIEPFLELVDRNEYPDYYELIKKPMSMAKVEAKIKSSGYSSMHEFKSDVLLIFSNCKTYNQPNSGIYSDAETLENYFTDLYQAGPAGLGKKRSVGRPSLSAPKTPAASASPSANAPGSDSKKTKVRQKIPSGMVAPKPRPTDPFMLLFDCLERSDYKTFQETFDSVVTGPSVCNKLIPVNLFDNDFSWTLLHSACYYGSLKAVEMLIERGGNIEVEDTWYRGRPFAWATFGGHPKLCKVLMDKYKVDKDAKNIHGQTAYDLISDKNLPHWKALFAPDRKPTVYPINQPPKPASAKPAISVPTVLPPRRAAAYSNPVGVVPVSASSATKPSGIQPHYLPNMSNNNASRHGPPIVTATGATLGKSYPPRRGAAPDSVSAPASRGAPPPMMQPFQQPIVPKASYMPTEYQNYIEQRRETQVEVALITKLTISTEDESFFLNVPISPNDPEFGYSGSFIALPKGLLKVKVHVELTGQPFAEPRDEGFRTLYTVSGHHGHSMNHRGADGHILFQQVSVPILMEGTGDLCQVQDFELKLGDALNSVELAVTATSWGDADVVFGVHQTYCLLLGKQ